MDHTGPSTPTKATAARASQACVPCRSRHVRCDANQPCCDRCSGEGRKCHYVKSRRGGLDRAQLAIRRARNAEVTELPSTNHRSSGREDGSRQEPDSSNLPSSSLCDGYWDADPETSSNDRPCGTHASSADVRFLGIANDPLIDGYYRHFHKCHPFVLPRDHFQRIYGETTYQAGLNPLISVMRFIGSLYVGQGLSTDLRKLATEAIDGSPQHSPDPFMAQCHLLFSIALYWCGHKAVAREEIDAAIRIALDLAMFNRRFATENGNGDAVLEESWRRTWWQIFIIDAYYAAIRRVPIFSTCNVNATVDLPCEEDEYESGAIPTPKTLEEFDSREFAASSHTYSSFGYLIGATRGIALAIAAVPAEIWNWNSQTVIAEVDAIIDGWLLLLPESKREVLRDGNVVDELMFQAYMATHASAIGLHRPFSDLLFNPLECISSCLVTPPDRLPVQESVAIHTRRCLRSIEAQIRLLVLPCRSFCRTPFTICMAIAGTIPLLSAAKFLFRGQKLAVARHQIRLIVGYLGHFAKVWPQGKRSLSEIQTIAREVLRETARESQRIPHTGKSPAGHDQDSQLALGNEPREDWDDLAAPLDCIDDLQPYWSLNDDLQVDVPIWFTNCYLD